LKKNGREGGREGGRERGGRKGKKAYIEAPVLDSAQRGGRRSDNHMGLK
jgi:hypothetical protein